jgi:AraC-like DNA-binding protein
MGKVTGAGAGELLSLAMRYCASEGIHTTPLQGFKVVRRDSTMEATPGRYAALVCLVLQGEKRVWSGKRVFRYDPENYLVSCVDVPAVLEVSKASPQKPYVGLTLELLPSVVYDILQGSPAMSDGERNPGGGFFVEPLTHELTDAFTRLLKSLEDPHDVKILTPSIVREIHYRLMNSRYGSRIRQLGVVGSKAQRISKVVDHLSKEYAAPLRVPVLAQMANMSPSAFHLHFRNVTNMSPLQYQKQIRLQEARRLLSTGSSDAASVAFEVGYESPSQFSREYRRLFGQPPMRDVDRLRSPGASPRVAAE